MSDSLHREFLAVTDLAAQIRRWALAADEHTTKKPPYVLAAEREVLAAIRERDEAESNE